MCEERAGAERRRVGGEIEHGRAGDVAGQHVGGELHASEVQVRDLGEAAGGDGLRHAGHVVEQDVAAGEQAGQHERQLGPFADDDALDLVEQPVGVGGRGATRRRCQSTERW